MNKVSGSHLQLCGIPQMSSPGKLNPGVNRWSPVCTFSTATASLSLSASEPAGMETQETSMQVFKKYNMLLKTLPIPSQLQSGNHNGIADSFVSPTFPFHVCLEYLLNVLLRNFRPQLVHEEHLRVCHLEQQEIAHLNRMRRKCREGSSWNRCVTTSLVYHRT